MNIMSAKDQIAGSAIGAKRYSWRNLAVWGLGCSLLVNISGANAAASGESSADPFLKLTQTDLNLGVYRSANGLPAANYWQQAVDYKINAILNPVDHEITATATIDYQNNSPDTLSRLYFALDHNAFRPESDASFQLLTSGKSNSRSRNEARKAASGFNITDIRDNRGNELSWRERGTNLQITLPKPLRSGDNQKLQISWTLPLTDKVATGVRSGYETLTDNTRIYVAAHWFPRAVAYTDYAGWQLKPFLQQGEFSTEFGDYSVTISVPENYTVAASGGLQNPQHVLNKNQFSAWKNTSQEAVAVIGHEDAIQRRKGSSDKRLRWTFSGEAMRDFAFAASPAFLWQAKEDAQGRKLQQFYPQEAASLWERFGLAAIDHTLSVYDDALMPLNMQSISVVNAAGIGMEYPGLATVATRPEREVATEELPAWDRLTKYDFIGSVIHEVGHNYLPMKINTDEREWAWLDEGLVSFIEYRAEHSWEASFDVIYGEPRTIARYTDHPLHQPIMSSADSLHRKIDNAYNKTASMLNTLRHLVLGPEVFDPALSAFAKAWEGKRPMPGDFFRAIESASGNDLSWFWRSWFYENQHIDLAISAIALEDRPLVVSPKDMRSPPAMAYTVGNIRDFVVDQDSTLIDTYTTVLPQDLLDTTTGTLGSDHPKQNTQWYTLTIENHGNGLLPIPLRLDFHNASSQSLTIPAYAWMNAKNGAVQLELPVGSPLVSICVDPLWLTPDTNRKNNCVEVENP
ncbi:M1 family metallopeptidase [Microbulbifer agarilyticus]|uniref:M1 family metallopeptidase n=1 Tax=Microbulbifer agarilyticus TaxID=260552 RepID=UPI001C949961|nr:M1 family metallopeptidase [Microbulbifer agarilyticus]MBY6188966.1 M1 family metallopeptidase [Microbulbifer agarilyticus]